jgi:hypothetical protein
VLNPYMGFDRECGAPEGACLVFAHTAKEARVLAYGIVRGWFDSQWIDTGVRRLRDMPWLFAEADQAKLAEDVAHGIECPATCPTCELWGLERTAEGRCIECGELVRV